MKKQVLDVGQCDADHFSIKKLVESLGGEIVRAHTINEALEIIQEGDISLILVNRIIDSDGSEGMKLIEKVQKDQKLKQIPIMLISNYEEAQNEALKKGAVQGFGKKQLYDKQTREKLLKYLS